MFKKLKGNKELKIGKFYQNDKFADFPNSPIIKLELMAIIWLKKCRKTNN
jgi:hypothetical protein